MEKFVLVNGKEVLAQSCDLDSIWSDFETLVRKAHPLYSRLDGWDWSKVFSGLRKQLQWANSTGLEWISIRRVKV